DWYRPDLMAIIAVGDFDVSEMEKKIIAQFSSVPVVKNPRPLQVWTVPDDVQLAITTCTDKEAQNAEVEIIYKQPVSEQGSVADYRLDMARSLFSGMFSARLAELQRSADPPFLYAGGNYGDLVRNKDAYTVYAMSKEDAIERALLTLVQENERVRRYGFTATELSRQKADMMSYVEKMYNERDMTESRGLATECVANFLRQEPMPGIIYEYALYKKYLDGITLEEVNAFADKWITDGKNCVVLVTAPEKPELKMPSNGRIREIMNGARQLELVAYVDKVIDKPLVDEASLKPGKIIKETGITELGVKEWALSNGVRVLYKKTDFKDEVIMNSYSWGGWSIYEESDFLNAAACATIIDQSGLGPYDATTLEKALSGKIVGCSPYVSDITQGVNGTCAPKDLETLFQLTYGYFTAPRKDTAAFRSYMVKATASLRNRGSDPQSVFFDTMTYAMSGYNARFRPRTVEMMDAIDHERVMAIYRERFSGAGGLTFCFVGSIDEVKLRAFAEKYLASLPAPQKRSSYRDLGITSPKGNFERIVLKGTEPKSTVVMRFNLAFEYNRKNRNEVSALAKLLNIRLREVLREEMSGVYGVSCTPGIKHYPNPSLEFTISFSCAPENVEPLSKAALNVIEELKTKGCEEKNLIKIKETSVRERQTSMKENQFWISSISSNDQNGEDLKELLKYEEWVNSISTSDMLAYAKKYLDTTNYARFILNPEK
ncbi:MAG: M16 family metallopeptidase, partial [Bacteroidota bacterium]